MRERKPSDLRLANRVIPVNKSAGSSTYDCIRQFKRLVNIEKVGHAGSLDPTARGLILLLTGEATKLSNYLMDLPKRYLAEIKMGEATDSQDSSGSVIKTGSWQHVTEDMVRKVSRRFIGRRFQTPPMYSALKHKGQPLYVLARRGERVDRAPREVETYEITVANFDPPIIRLEVFCSRGLYLRVLAEEIGEALGVPAHLGNLVRLEIGHFKIEEAVPESSLADLLDMESPGYSMNEAMKHIPSVALTQQQSRILFRGATPRLLPAQQNDLPPIGCLVRLERPDKSLAAIAEVAAAGLLKLRRVFRELTSLE